MRRQNIRFTLIFGLIAIIGIVSVQVYFIRTSYSLEEKQLNQSIVIALRNVAEIICDYNNCTLPYENVVFQYSSDYYMVNINTIIDAAILENYLIKELTSRGIMLDFEYAIYDCQSDEMVYGNFVDLNKNENIRTNRQLPTTDEYLYYFGIRFPGREKYVWSNLAIWYFFSVILFIVIVFFIYSEFIILKQKRLSEIQKDFINNITHEFKTPLTSISLSADVMKSQEIEGDQKRLHKYAKIIKNQSNIILDQINRVLVMADAEELKLKLNKEEIEICPLINELILNYKILIYERQGRIHFNCNGPGMIVRADRFHIYNTLSNIVDNAVKYTVEKPVISIDVKKCKKKVCISIKDNGPGIPRKYQKKVFRKFFRIPTGNIHNTKGFGLGLSYVKRIVHLHRGKIRLVSHVKENGTEIIIIL